MKDLTESDVKNLLAKEIVVAKQNQVELTYTPLHNEFKLYIDSILKTVLYSIDTAVDYYKNLKIKTYEAIKTVLETSGDDGSRAAALKTVREMKNREYMLIEFEEGTTNCMIIKSVYQRIPEDIEDFIKRLNLNKTKIAQKERGKEKD